MAKWKLPEGREPMTAMESADLVLRMRDKLAAGFSKGDRIATLEEMVEAAKQDAKEAEAYAEELEAKLAKAVVGLTQIERAYYQEATNPSPETIRRMAARMNGIARDTQNAIAELKGKTDE